MVAIRLKLRWIPERLRDVFEMSLRFLFERFLRKVVQMSTRPILDRFRSFLQVSSKCVFQASSRQLQVFRSRTSQNLAIVQYTFSGQNSFSHSIELGAQTGSDWSGAVRFVPVISRSSRGSVSLARLPVDNEWSVLISGIDELQGWFTGFTLELSFAEFTLVQNSHQNCHLPYTWSYPLLMVPDRDLP